MPGKCVFNDLWLTNDRYKDWLVKGGSDRHTARCSLCVKTFDIGNMGEAAIISHLQGKKHAKLLSVKVSQEASNTRIVDFFNRETSQPGTSASVGETVSSTAEKRQAGSTLSSVVCREDHWKAEIMWAMKTVVSRYSYKSCENIEDLFKKMFPDSEIAKTFTCGEKKCAYVVCFGLAPHFRRDLLDKITGINFVLLFDEALNHKTQNKQMDVFIRYFDNDSKRVITRYFDSAFIGHSTAADMMTHFMELTKNLKLKNMIQLSMDGPNVNWSFFDKLSSELKTVETDPSLINIGSCGLHILHGAFKHSCDSIDWDIAGLLRSMHILLKDTPARRDDYEEITGSKVYPLKHCATRWVEDVPVANRAIEVLPHMTKYVETVEKNPKKFTVPKTLSFSRVKEATKDPLTLVKLNLFVSLAEEFLPFLAKFQTDNPVLPFLSPELEKLLRNLMARCVKSNILNQANSASLLLKVDMSKTENLKNPSRVNVGFSATNKLKELLVNKTISERQELEFRLESRNMIVKAIVKLLEKCPLRYALTRNVVCLSPIHMATDPDDSRSRFNRVLTSLVNCKRIEESNCDNIIKEYDQFLNEVVRPNKRIFKDFNMKNNRLDDFLSEHMGSSSNYSGLLNVTRMIMILSHGQASVERGFSINKGLMVDNMSEKSISAQRVVHDYVQSCGGIGNVPITKQVITAAQSGRMKYTQYLDEKKQEHIFSEKETNRKRKREEICVLQKKRKCLKTDIEVLISSADELAESAEKKGNLTDLAKSNSFRKSARSKQCELETVDFEINKLTEN